MYYGKINENDIANGLGVRVTLFVSGCTHHCKNCFNPETWDFRYGREFTKETENYILDLCKRPHIKGLSLLGGEPFEKANQECVCHLLKRFKETYPQKDVWCYSGYTFDKDMVEGGKIYTPYTREMLSYIDYLVDGEFVEEKKNLMLKFRGSSNQRIIDVQRSLKENKTICVDDKDLEKI